MSIARAILVILTAFSLAVLPVAGAAARGSSDVTVSTHADCCPPGQDCDEHSKRDCTKDASCALKCSSVTVAPLAEIDAVHTSYRLPRSVLVTGIAPSLAPIPPSPPPRA